MKRLFIIGASVLQLPAIKRAKELGYYVAVADYDPAAVGIAYANEYFNVSTIDEQGIYEAAKKFGADGIMTLATDMPMRSVAYACKKLGLIGISYDTAVKTTDKEAMIQAFEAAGVEHPWYHVVGSPEDALRIVHKVSYPCIVKPTDNSGSRGVTLAHTPEELLTAIVYSANNGRGGKVIVQEYMQGPEVSVEIIVHKGTPHVLQVTDKITSGAPHFVETGHTQPSRLASEDLEAICDLACRAIHSVGLTDGPAHVEIILTENGPKMVEMGARMGGGCITTHLVPLSTGIDMIKATIDCALGIEPDIVPKHEKGSAIRFFLPTPGVIQSIQNIDVAQNAAGVKELTFTKTIGDTTAHLTSGANRLGYVIVQANSATEAAQLCEQAHNIVSIVIS